MAIAVTNSPVQNPGSHRSFCESVARSKRYGATTSVWMVRHEANPTETLASSSGKDRVEAEVAGVVPAVLLRHVESEKALATRLEPDAAVDRALRHHLVVDGDDGPGHEGLHGFAELVVVLVEQRPLHVAPRVRRPMGAAKPDCLLRMYK